MSDNYDEIDELMDWEEMDREPEASNRGSKPTGCCLLPCLSMLAVILLIVGAMTRVCHFIRNESSRNVVFINVSGRFL